MSPPCQERKRAPMIGLDPGWRFALLSEPKQQALSCPRHMVRGRKRQMVNQCWGVRRPILSRLQPTRAQKAMIRVTMPMMICAAIARKNDQRDALRGYRERGKDMGVRRTRIMQLQ